MSELEEYTRKHRHFLRAELPPLLAEVARPGTIADLGCGDGAILYALHRQRRLGATTYAVDVSPERVRVAESVASGVRGIVADVIDVPAIPTASVDGVVCSQVIEHVANEALVMREIARIVKPGGWWYVGSVVRGRRAWWIYRVDGARRLDPTHVREYESEAQFAAAVERDDLEISRVRSTPLRFPLYELALRALARSGAISHDRLTGAYLGHERVATLLGRLRIRVPGYRLVEAAGTRR